LPPCRYWANRTLRSAFASAQRRAGFRYCRRFRLLHQWAWPKPMRCVWLLKR